jgi:hypothetical protein
LNYLAAKQLKLALEKKMSKEQNNSISNSLKNSEAPSAFEDAKPQNTEIKITAVEKNTKNTELKLTYQPNLGKRGETPPPRRILIILTSNSIGEENNKKATESVYAKALSKSSLMSTNTNTPTTNKSKTDTSLSTSNYFQNLFPSTLMQLNSLTPSASNTTTHTIDKKTPSSTKATSSGMLSFSLCKTIGTYNFGPYRSQTNLQQRPHSSHQTKENQSGAALIDNLMKSSNTFINYQPNQSSQPFGLRTQINNYTNNTNNSGSKNGPIK